MKMRLMRKIKNTKDDNSVKKVLREINWEENMVQHSGEGENDDRKETEGDVKPPMMTMSERTKMTEGNDRSEEKSSEQLKKETRKRLKNLNKMEDWTFQNSSAIYRNKELSKFQAVVNAEMLAYLYDKSIIFYSGDIQRGWRTNSKGEQLAVRSEKHIREILQSLLEFKMHGGVITLNYQSDEDIEFNEEDHTISAPISHKLQILDGQHRLAAFSKWAKLYKRDPQSVPNPADYEIVVLIEMLDDDSAKSLFSEYCLKSLKINKSRGEFLNVTDNTNKLCREIMKKSDIKVEVISTAIKANSENIITFGVLSKNIKDNFAPQTKREIEELSDYLTMFIDSLIFTFPKFMASKDLENRAELRKQYLTMEPLAWGGYMKISTRLQGKSREEILDVLSKFNAKVKYKGWSGSFLDRENPIFRKIMREGFKIINTSSSATWVNKVFVDYIIEGKTLEEIGKE